MNDLSDIKPIQKRRSLPLWLLIVLGLAVGAALSVIVIRNSVKMIEWGFSFIPVRPIHAQYSFSDTAEMTASIRKIEKENSNLIKKIDKFTPAEPYLIINTTANTFKLMKSRSTLRDGICSTGSYTLLKAGDQQEWIFKTPRGMFRIQGKKTKPVWTKPDWAFVEEGLPVPAKDAPERYESGVLGDYAMTIGDGYMIHGTLYKRFLGLPVTHGCVRMGDDDLEIVFKNMNIGSKVFIL